jgi:hypothetical protein
MRRAKDHTLKTSLQDSKRYTTYVEFTAPGLVIRQLVVTSVVEEGNSDCDWQATAEGSPGLY